jgi:hypothetical protein
MSEINMFDKYVIFLPNKYEEITTHCIPLNNSRKSLTNELLEKGINVMYRKSISDIVKNTNNTFDGEKMPKISILYTHFFNGEYFSEDQYDNEKTKRERDILFILSAMLGAKKITYNTEIINTIITKIKADISTNIDIDIGVLYNKKSTITEGKNGVEIYENRGAPVYLISCNLEQVNNDIKENFDNNCKGFYEFYNSNSNLVSFVRKRFSYKMTKTEFTSKTEDDSNINIEVKSLLMKYGLGINYDNYEIKSSIVNYTIEFYTDSELRVGMNTILAHETDPFTSILEIYNHEKNLSIYRITEYVSRYATEQKYYIIENNIKKIFDYQVLLEQWIHKNGNEKFNIICSNFSSSYQIRTWYRTELLKLLPENIKGYDEIDETDRMDSYGLIALKKKNFDKYNTNNDKNINKLNKYVEPFEINTKKYILSITNKKNKNSSVNIEEI